MALTRRALSPTDGSAYSAQDRQNAESLRAAGMESLQARASTVV